MENIKKKTKKEMYAQILSHTTDPEEREFLEHEQELLAKKNAGGAKTLTPTQKANEDTKSAIVEHLSAVGEGMTITDMIKNVPACEGLTNQKVSSLVRQLCDALVLVRYEEKGRAYFKVA